MRRVFSILLLVATALSSVVGLAGEPASLGPNQGYMKIDGVETSGMTATPQPNLAPGFISLNHSNPSINFSMAFPKGVKPGKYIFTDGSFGKPGHWSINGTVGDKGIGIGKGYRMEATIKKEGKFYVITFSGQLQLLSSDKRLVPVEGMLKIGK